MSGFWKWGYHGTVSGVHNDKTVKLNRSGNETSILLADLIQDKVPLFLKDSKFKLKPYLVNGGLQAMYSSSLNQQLMYKVWYGRDILNYVQSEKYPHLHDGETTVDYVVKLDLTEEEFELNYTKTLPEGYPRLHPRTRYMTKKESESLHQDWANNGKLIVVMIHGLLGGSQEYHVRGCAEKLSENGFNVVVLNSRGCCRSKVTTPHSFTALSTDDIRFYIDQLLEQYPNSKIHLLGFSYGAAVLTNYIGEEGDNSKITSVFVLGCPWDFVETSYRIHGTYLGSKVFAPMLAKYLVRFMEVQKDTLAMNPDLHIEERLAKAKLEKFTKIYQFDSLFTAPLHGFQTLYEYYRRASPIHQLLNVKTPFMALNSLDDPVVSIILPTMEFELNPYLYLAQTDIGGHFNYIQNDNSLWFIDGVLQFFKLFDDVVGRESDYIRMVNDYAYKIGK